MLGVVALIFGVYLSVKLAFHLNHHKSIMMEYGISPANFILLQGSCFLYVVSLIVFVILYSALAFLYPIPVGFVILLPGILLGRKISNILDRAGVDKAASAGKVANNIMWLGIGVGVFIAANVLFALIYHNIGNNFPG